MICVPVDIVVRGGVGHLRREIGIMSCVYQIDSRRRLIHLIIEGQVLGEELVAFERNLQADPQYDPDFDQLADVRRWLPPVADLDTLQELARGLAP